MTIKELKKDAKVKLTGSYGKAIAIGLVYFLLIFCLNALPTFSNNNLLAFISLLLLAIISVPLSFGMISAMIKIIRNEDVNILDFIKIGFKNFKGVWRTYLRTIVKLLLPIILLVASYVFLVFTLIQTILVGGLQGNVSADSTGLFFISLGLVVVSLIFFVYKSLSYSLTMYILHDSPDSTGKEINEESANLMKGNKWKLVGLSFSFIGWFFLIAIVSSLLYTFGGKLTGLIVSSLGSILLSPYINASLVCFYEDLKDKNEPIKEAE